MGVTVHFSEIIELKFEKIILKLFENDSCLIIAEKNVRLPPFLFLDFPVGLAKICLFPIVVAFAKIPVYHEAPS